MELATVSPLGQRGYIATCFRCLEISVISQTSLIKLTVAGQVALCPEHDTVTEVPQVLFYVKYSKS